MAGSRRIFGSSGDPNLRRVLIAALVGALALAAFAGARSAGDAHAATTCTKHTKRVVKHVKRHGKLKKIVRLHPYWTCQEVAEPVAAAPVTPAPPAPAPMPTPAPTPEPEANALSVSAYDIGGDRYELSRPSVRSGSLTVQLINRGEDPHNMDIQKLGPNGELVGEPIQIPTTKAGVAGEPRSITVEAGTYKMWCTIGEHAAKGMRAEITVG
jgi:plastocyanin